MMRYLLLLLTVTVLLTACGEGDPEEVKLDMSQVDTYSESDNIMAVIEIPAGTNMKYEYDEELDEFVNDQIDGAPRKVRFLPYPGNYGFVPNTTQREDEGGDGDALDILVISEAVPRGTAMEVVVIGALELFDRGERDTKIIAVPADAELRTADVTDYTGLAVEMWAAKQIIEYWFLNYKGTGVTDMTGWYDEKYARALIDRYRTGGE